MGFKALKSIIKAGKNVVDISFFPEDPFLLDDLAKQKGVTAIVDCGVARVLQISFSVITTKE